MAAAIDFRVQSDALINEFEELKLTLEAQIAQNNELIIYKEKYQDLILDFNDINSEYDALIKKDALIAQELHQLRNETEKLSGELFNEANNMVSIERAKAHKYSQEAKLLKNEITEQKLIMKMYEHQLQSLKETVAQLQNENDDMKSKIEKAGFASPFIHNDDNAYVNEDHNKKLLANILFTPTVQALRHDLRFYHSFIDYIHANQLLFNTKAQPDYKDAYFFKRLLVEDIDPTLNLETAQTLSFFQKKNVYNSVLNQAIRIEPFSSSNDKLVKRAKVGGFTSGDKLQNNVIFMSKKCCSLCSEDRNDTLEHARLYSLKTIPSKKTSPSLTSRMFMANVDPISNIELPLCNYCLSRVRAVCDLVGFLNSIQKGVIHISKEDKVSAKRVYLELNRHRAKLFWNRVGVAHLDSLFIENTSFSEKQLDLDYTFSQLTMSPELSRNSSPSISVSRISSPALSSPELDSPLGDYKTELSSVSSSPIIMKDYNKIVYHEHSAISDTDSESLKDFEIVSRNVNKIDVAPKPLKFGPSIMEKTIMQSPTKEEQESKQLANPLKVVKQVTATAVTAASAEKKSATPSLKASPIIEAGICSSPSNIELKCASPIIVNPKASPAEIETLLSEKCDTVELDDIKLGDIFQFDELLQESEVFGALANETIENHKNLTADFENVVKDIAAAKSNEKCAFVVQKEQFTDITL